MKKKLFSVKALVATAIGTALFLVLFMFVKIPSWVPETNIQIAYSISTFFGALFGPVCSGLIAFIGHALNDFIGYGSPWWSWVIASMVAGAIGGLAYFKMDLQAGDKPNAWFFIFNIGGHAVAWLLVAPLLDILIYKEPSNLVFTQGLVAFLVNALGSIIIGSILTIAYGSSRAKKASLEKEN